MQFITIDAILGHDAKYGKYTSGIKHTVWMGARPPARPATTSPVFTSFVSGLGEPRPQTKLVKTRQASYYCDPEF